MAHDSAMVETPLQALLPSTPYLLAYTLPLFLISCPLTFAGCFLTLDRTRVFSPRSDAGYEASSGWRDRLAKHKGAAWLVRIPLRGGVGGIAAGYLFGLHLSTFLALLIPGVTSSPSLSHQVFVVVWLLSSIPTTFLAGRWKYASLAVIGLSGGTTFALALCVITHPALLTRIVICAITTGLFLLGSVLPIARTQHSIVRLCTASTGSFGLVVSIALLAHAPSWANVWTRLWISDGDNWGVTATERGLSAAFVLLLVLGVACDWFLHRKLGENPDEKWDAYLADYAANLPNAPGRSGVFQSMSSPWAGLFNHKHANHDPTIVPLFSTDQKDSPDSPVAERKGLENDGLANPAPPPSYRDFRQQKSRSDSFPSGPASPVVPPFSMPKRPVFLKKRTTGIPAKRRPGGREAVRFRAAHELSSSDSSGDESDIAAPSSASGAPRSSAGRSSSSATVVARLTPPPRIKAADAVKGETVYSDYESDGMQKVSDKNLPKRGEPGWSPGFIRKASIARSETRTASSTGSGLTTTAATSTSHRASETNSKSGLTTPSPDSPTISRKAPESPARAVPATPSLIRAIDRLARAQGDAYGFPPMPSPSTPGSLAILAEADKEQRGEGWARFWRDVKDRAGAPAPHENNEQYHDR